MLKDPRSKMAGSAPDVAGITCRTGIFVNQLRTQILSNGVLKLEPRTQILTTFKDNPKGQVREELFNLFPDAVPKEKASLSEKG